MGGCTISTVAGWLTTPPCVGRGGGICTNMLAPGATPGGTATCIIWPSGAWTVSVVPATVEMVQPHMV